jgi:hypothetical protein
MRTQSSLYRKNSGNYVDYQDFTSSSQIAMRSSSSIPTCVIEVLNWSDIINPAKIIIEQTTADKDEKKENSPASQANDSL